MSLKIPRRTRILVAPDDERPTREYVLGRGTVVTLLAVLAALVVLVAAMAVSFGGLMARSWRMAELEGELIASRSQMSRVHEMERELTRMREFQESLLTMLGVTPQGELDRDTLVAGAATGAAAGQPRPGAESVAPPAGEAMSLAESAALLMTPPPDIWPVAGYVTREYDPGDIPNAERPHRGIDLVAPVGTPVRAAGRGVVLTAAWDEYLGNYVEIRHGFGYVTVYGHCETLAVRPGDRVDRGQTVGTLGGTGQVSAPHLHFEVWKGDAAVDPRSVIQGDPPTG